VRLLLTRPQHDAERTAAALSRQGHQVEIAPLMHIEPLTGAALGTGPWSGLIFTSANAVRGVEELAGMAALAEIPAFAVGERTAAAARAAGFRNVVAGGGDARQLTQAVRAWAEAGRGARRDPLLYLAGEDLSHDLAGTLAADGAIVHTVTVYRAVKAERFPARLQAALRREKCSAPSIAPAASAEAFLDCARAAGALAQALHAAHYCISHQAAAPLITAGAAHVHVAAHPDEASLLALVGKNA